MEYKCKRCNHEWTARSENKPAACPKCKSYKWNESRKNKAEVESDDSN